MRLVATPDPDRREDSAPPPVRGRRRAQVLAAVQYVVVMGGAAWLLWRGAAAMQYEWQWARVPELLMAGGRPGPLLLGLFATLRISVLAMGLAAVLGVGLALANLSASWSAVRLSAALIGLVRNTPLIVQVSLFYFVIAPVFGIDRFWSGVASLALFESVFIAHIVRSGLLAVPVGQWEAGMALGLGRGVLLRRVVLPQMLRLMLPPLTNTAVSLVKDSAIVSVIALFELTTAGRNAISDTYMSFEIWLTVAALYLALTFAMSLAARALERRLARPYQT